MKIGNMYFGYKPLFVLFYGFGASTVTDIRGKTNVDSRGQTSTIKIFKTWTNATSGIEGLFTK